MKKYFNIIDISEMFHNKISEEEIISYFEKGKIKSKKIEDEWYADQEAINKFKELLVKERAFVIGSYKINLTFIRLKGRILDIGGGGRGVIGQFKGEQVIAIDHFKNELEDAHDSGDLKIIMDAKDLRFLDNTFDTVTSFFTLMYASLEDHKKIFQEIYRVLKLSGEFVLWDVVIPNRGNNKKDIFYIRLEIKIMGKQLMLLMVCYGIKDKIWNTT